MTFLRAPLVALPAMVSLALSSACDRVPQDAIQKCGRTVTQGSVATDILFVIDDSLSMSPHQQTLRTALGTFIDNLANSPIENDYQIGVTTTSIEDYQGETFYPSDVQDASGTWHHNPMEVGTPYPRGIVTAVDTTYPGFQLTNSWTWGKFYWNSVQGFYDNRILHGFPTMTVAEKTALIGSFDGNSLVGEWGAGREQPFEAMRLALTEQMAPGRQNSGFLRPGARLAIIFLSDEDDCSGPRNTGIRGNQDCRNARIASPSPLVPVANYASFLLNPIAGERRDVVMAAIVGVTCTNGVCVNTLCGNAPPPTGTGATTTPDRILALLGTFSSSHTRIASICDADFAQALTDFAALIRSRTLPLEGAPADPHMLVVTIERGGMTITCQVNAAAGAGTTVVYEAPQSGRPASLTFPSQGDCALQQGDRIDVKVVCAG